MRERVIYVTAGEASELLSERLRAIKDVAAARLPNDGRLRVEASGIRGTLYVSSRDRDGCVLATVCCQPIGDRSTTRYVRKLRVIPRRGKRSVPFRQRDLTRRL